MPEATSKRLPRIRQLQAQLERPRGRLKFEPALEQQFREHLNAVHRAPRLISSLLLIGALVIIVFADYCCLAQRLSPLDIGIVLLGICAPLAIIQALRYGFTPAHSPLQSSPAITTALYAYIGFVYLVVLARTTTDGDQAPFLYEVFLIHSVFMYFVSGLRFVPTVLLGFGMWVAYIAVESSMGLARSALFESALFLFTANCVGAVSRYLGESMHRQQYLSAQLLGELASHDPLTGVLNRRAFESGLDRVWRQARRENVPVTLAVLDLDHFKAFNDRAGHARGDELLAALAETLRDMAQRPLDLVARVGGDEFVCMWYGIPDSDVARYVAEVHGTLNDRLRAEQPGESLPVSVSLGAVHVKPNEDLSPVTLFSRADAVLYHAKEAGRSRAAVRREAGEVVLV